MRVEIMFGIRNNIPKQNQRIRKMRGKSKFFKQIHR